MAAPTTVAEPRWVWPTVWVAFPVLGAGAGGLLKVAAGWVASLPAAPMQGWFALADSAPEPLASVAALLLGTLAGGVVAAISQQESLTVTVAPAEVTLRRGERTGSVPRDGVAAVFLDGEELVLLGRAGEELQRWPNDRPAQDLGAAFRRHGYPWCADGDPHLGRYRRWVPDLPDLPPGADALFTARQKALDNGDHDEAADLRWELGRLGLVVRQDGTRQYWRRVEAVEPPGAHDGSGTDPSP